MAQLSVDASSGDERRKRRALITSLKSMPMHDRVAA